MENPLVSVVCLCYNHAPYLREALDSMMTQTYRNAEVIVVDDASTDGSADIIREYEKAFPYVKAIYHNENKGNCVSFNEALKHCEGKYVIDFATDDVMFPNRIEEQVNAFEALNDDYAMTFTDAVFIDQDSKLLGNHYQRDQEGKLAENVPQGDVYSDVIARYFICTPTMMMRRKPLVEMGGYDENLSHEDFDYWVRTARKYKFHYLDKVLTAKRIIPTSKSARWYEKDSEHLRSTYQVCEKIAEMNAPDSAKERAALTQRLRFEIRQSVFSGHREEAKLFYRLLRKASSASLFDHVLMVVNTLHLPLSRLHAYRDRRLNRLRVTNQK